MIYQIFIDLLNKQDSGRIVLEFLEDIGPHQICGNLGLLWPPTVTLT